MDSEGSGDEDNDDGVDRGSLSGFMSSVLNLGDDGVVGRRVGGNAGGKIDGEADVGKGTVS